MMMESGSHKRTCLSWKPQLSPGEEAAGGWSHVPALEHQWDIGTQINNTKLLSGISIVELFQTANLEILIWNHY